MLCLILATYATQRRSLDRIVSTKTLAPPPPKDMFGKISHRIVTSKYFDWVIFVVVVIDISLIIAQLTVSMALHIIVFRYINCIIVAIYTNEAFMKVLCF